MRVVAAMSGGVDSSVVAGLLVEQGHDVIGVHMKLHDAPAHPSVGDGKHCCGLDDALDARRVADRLGIPFYVMDLRQAFQKAVMDEFVATYRAGATPNPCIRCNGVLKFKVLLQRARALGASHLATGHYARIDGGGLREAADPDKDQTYFLFPVTPAALAQTLFPLGGLTKPEVRAHADRMGLLTAQKPESQEVCFIPDDDHARFVAEASPDVDGAGAIVHHDGRVLGQHDGYWRFTIGQRRGLGVSVGAPLYVLAIDPVTRRVTVGPPELLLHQAVRATGLNWYQQPDPGQVVQARIRHRGGLVPATVELDPATDAAWVRFRAPARAAARGQAVVLYDEGRVLGGGSDLRGDGLTDPFDLYRRALTHRSYTAERGGESYERLEFLGDAVLQLAVSEMLFERFGDEDPGTLHNRRKQMVQNEALADVSRELDLLSVARIGRGEARNAANRSVKLEADLVEALLGAVYLDQGWEVARAVVEARWRRRLGRTRKRAADPKIALQELSHQRSGQPPTYRLVGHEGPDHNRVFTMAVEVEGRELGRGEGTSKKAAERAAAARALAALDATGAS